MSSSASGGKEYGKLSHCGQEHESFRNQIADNFLSTEFYAGWAIPPCTQKDIWFHIPTAPEVEISEYSISISSTFIFTNFDKEKPNAQT